MNLASKLLSEINTPGLDPIEVAARRCLLAKELEDSGNYEGAREALGELWDGIGERPKVDGLDEPIKAELLMRAGALTGWLGSSAQRSGAQERAKDLISESILIFDELANIPKTAEARIELAYCYWREGAFDEARVTLSEAKSRLTESDKELLAVALLRTAIVEMSDQRPNDALRIFTDSGPLFDTIESHSIKGRYHVGLATTLKNLGTTERREDYMDRSLVEYSAASYHFEQAGHSRYRARVENNLGFLFLTLAKFNESHDHLDRARRLFVGLKDTGSTAQVDETRARAFIAQQRYLEAEKAAKSAVLTLEKGGEQALLAEALTTYGLTLSRLGQTEQSRNILQRAIGTAEQAGDLEGAGRAALTVLEELKQRLTEEEARATYAHADQLLAKSTHSETISRLRECARHLLNPLPERATEEPSTTFVYASEKTALLLQQARRLASIDRPVMITGETGTGKEALARLIHEWSGRGGRFVVINCAALTDASIESQLFGHKKGGFTDATQDYPGAVREAAGGTLLLDEVGELSRANQIKILQLIERGEFHPLGAASTERINVRIIAASNHSLAEQVTAGSFRQDLFYRLHTFHLEIPPLRERPEDIPTIAEHFISEACERHHKHVTFRNDSLAAMRALPLMGNASELRILIERTLLKASDGSEIPPDAIETVALRQTVKAGFAEVWEGCSLVEEVQTYEKALILRALNSTHGGVTRAARLLGVTHQTLSFILNTRHSDLLSVRKPVMKRRRSIIRPDFDKTRRTN